MKLTRSQLELKTGDSPVALLASRIAPHASRLTRYSGLGTPHSERAIALVIVMIAILVLAVLAGGFAWSMKVETTLARNANSEEELQWLGRSGVEYAKWVLSWMDPTRPYDSLNQTWATGEDGAVVGPTNSDIVVHNPVFLGHGNFKWKITDLESKFNINSPEPMLQQILPRALTTMGADPSESSTVVNSILDWIDPDDQPHIDGAETDYYQGLPIPYTAKNGPIDDISELQLIRGISQEMYWGSSSTNHPRGAFQQRQNRFGAPLAPPSYAAGLPDLFTPISDGKININTASAKVLQLVVVDETLAEAIVAGREGEDDGTGLIGPYKNLGELTIKVPQLPRGPLPPEIAQFCDVRSKSFEVHVTAQIGNYQREFIATLARNTPRDIQILNFYWK